ncbi:MAG: dinitrogenase iron-molybdenum cofactor biosynthesis protein [Chloroflexales bacterium]|nr:dinitrogenase iron-molybdenum cofactor biosynthesis protein [Chloroflexales bacterium]
MKIAFVSDNGTTISRHFGRARQYVVVTLTEGQEVAREVRAKTGCHGHHHHGAGHDHHSDQHDDHAHHDHAHHDDMLQAIADCEVLIAGGMGTGVDQRLVAAGKRTIRTQMQDIDQALQLFLAGRLGDTIELVH